MKQHPRKVLLLCNSHPTGSGVSEIFLRSLVERYHDDTFFRYSIVSGSKSADRLGIWCGIPYELASTGTSALPVASSLSDMWQRHALMPRITERVLQIIEEHRIDAIWAVLTSASTIYLTRALMRRTSLPVHSMVWDVPEHFTANLHLDPFTTKVWLRQFVDIICNSVHVAVASNGMREDFYARYKIQSIPILLANTNQSTPSNTPKCQHCDTIRIAFAGSLYAKDAWNSLIRALEEHNGVPSNRRVQVEFWGKFPHRNTLSASFVKQNGFVSPDALPAAIASCDMAYLPYAFSEHWRYVARTSFPTKLVGYLSAGLPVLYHGPYESTVTDFYSTYKVGPVCHSQNRDDIIAAVNLGMETNTRQVAEQARVAAMRTEFSVDEMLTRFAQFLSDK